MKRITTSLLLGSSLLATLPSHAGEWLQWHGESLTYLYGKDFKVNPDIQQTITFEHANKWKYGDTFMFVDKIFYNGKADRSKGVTTYYGEFSPRLSLGKISGADLSFGPIKDVLISATYERGEGRNRNYLLGPAVDLAIPGFDRFSLNTYYRKPDGITGKPGGQWQITPTWAMTFPVGKSDILFDGYIDWVVANPDWARFVLHSRGRVEASEMGEQLREANQQHYARILQALAAYREQGCFKAMPSDCFASVIIGPTHDFSRNWLAGRVRSDLAQCRDLFAQIAWDSVRAI